MDSFNVECSDDELRECTDSWEPPAEEIDRLYSMLDRKEIPELNWKSPGYRAPSPEASDEPITEIEFKP